MGFNDQQIRAMAGHPDAVPAVVIEAFLQGFRRCEEETGKLANQKSCKGQSKIYPAKCQIYETLDMGCSKCEFYDPYK